jgi:hypothetical protein
MILGLPAWLFCFLAFCVWRTAAAYERDKRAQRDQ